MIELSVCIGSFCHLNGARNVSISFQHMIEDYKLHDKVRFQATFCTGQCTNDLVCVRLGGEVHQISADSARAFFHEAVLPLVQ